jgi:two-component system CheB/CheR fusion protein
MILHELLTNALKYGALSAAQGQVRVTWEIAVTSGHRLLRIHWREEDGPMVRAPNAPGFGTRMIEFVAKHDLGGAAELSFEAEGFKATITIPIA